MPGKGQVLRSQADGGGVWGGDLSGLESQFLSLESQFPHLQNVRNNKYLTRVWDTLVNCPAQRLTDVSAHVW